MAHIHLGTYTVLSLLVQMVPEERSNTPTPPPDYD